MDSFVRLLTRLSELALSVSSSLFKSVQSHTYPRIQCMPIEDRSENRWCQVYAALKLAAVKPGRLSSEILEISGSIFHASIS